METCDDGESRHYCLAWTCRPLSELTGQLLWEQFYTNKWAALRKDPAVTTEAADSTLLFFHPVASFFPSGSSSTRPLTSPLSKFVS